MSTRVRRRARAQREETAEKEEEEKSKAFEKSKEEREEASKAFERSKKESKVGSDGVSSLVGSFWLTRIVLLRFITFIYFVAFLVAFNQNGALLGSRGLLPVPLFMRRVLSHADGSRQDAARMVPTYFWFCDFERHIDDLLRYTALAGLALSAFVLLTGCANMLLMFLLWALYHSIVNVGQRWYSFGWESQLLESGFLAMFLCPPLSLRRFSRSAPPSFLVIAAWRWLLFRIMLGAGLIKIRGDRCWRDLTCMHYHYQTQPVPNPVAYFMHQEPEALHKMETMVNHIVELAAPFLMLMPRSCCMLGGLVQIIFQFLIIVSGNYSFLNWLTMLPALACFDDAAWHRFFSRAARRQAMEAESGARADREANPWQARLRSIPHVLLTGLIAYLSIPVIQNLLSSRQLMNTSFDSLRLVNTYGAFGSITKERTEVILQGTSSSDPRAKNAQWLEFEFKCKPGSVTRRPCLISPYHYRLDWLMWFAAFQDFQHNEWLVHLAAKLLANDAGTSALMAHNPFLGGPAPLWVRAELFRYNYTAIGSPEARAGAWWRRERVREYLPPVNLIALKNYMDHFGWPQP